MTVRPIYKIAEEIRKDWQKPYFGAIPYLNAMKSMNNISETFGYDTGKSIVRYFLSNASTWRGEVAKRVKKELNDMLK